MTRIELRSQINNLKHGEEASINGYEIKRLGTQWVLTKGDHIKRSFDLRSMESALDRILGIGQVPYTRKEKRQAKLQQRRVRAEERKEARFAKLSPVQLLRLEQAAELKQLKADLVSERKQARLDKVAARKAAVQAKKEKKAKAKVAKRHLKADAQFRKVAGKKATVAAKRKAKLRAKEAKAIEKRMKRSR